MTEEKNEVEKALLPGSGEEIIKMLDFAAKHAEEYEKLKNSTDPENFIQELRSLILSQPSTGPDEPVDQG